MNNNQRKAVFFTSVEDNQFFFSPQTEALTEEVWQNLCKQRNGLYSVRLLRVVKIVDENSQCVFHVAPDVQYSDVIGLRNIDNFLNSVPQEDLFKALSAIAVVETDDNHTVLLERDSGDWEHSLELPGGFIRATETNNDLYTFIQTRVAQDFDIDKNAITSVEFIQSVDFKEIAEVMAVFHIRLSITLEKLSATSNTKIQTIPSAYEIKKHHTFFDLPLHYPSSVILKLLGK